MFVGFSLGGELSEGVKEGAVELVGLKDVEGIADGTCCGGLFGFPGGLGLLSPGGINPCKRLV